MEERALKIPSQVWIAVVATFLQYINKHFLLELLLF
jgi:hypothetical protein